MKSSISPRTYRAMYRLLDKVSPVPYDCGTLCGAACCINPEEDILPDNDEIQMGIYLYPGEEKLFTGNEDWLEWTVENAEDYDFPDSWHGSLYFASCLNGPVCPREKRPLQCRFFPLAPHIDKSGILHLIYSDIELPYVCPLIEEPMQLESSFIKATYTVWKHLIRDPYIYDLVIYDSSYRYEDDLIFVI